MIIGRLHIETFYDDRYYRDVAEGVYFWLGDYIEKTEFDYWCIRVRRICRGVWWASNPNVYERCNHRDLEPVLFNWFPLTGFHWPWRVKS